ncbi:MAG: EVE domain-containing protein [Roseomonas sp.]|nr:EVE domain-containing protein [Roseomonas sp.]
MAKTKPNPPPAFLVKSEPDVFGWEQQVANGVEPWTGVRNAQAANFLRAMQNGDRVFFYHSNIGKEVVGIVEVVRTAYQDPTDETGRWVCVDVKTVSKLPQPVTLAAIKAEPRLEGIGLIRQSRLSVMPITAEHAGVILEMAGLEMAGA